MKKYMVFPITAGLCGAAAFVLRLLQNRTGFEASTNLPVAGNIPGLILIAWLILAAVALFVLSRKLPAASINSTFPDAFSTANTSLLFLPVVGVFLIALSGLADLYEGLTMNRLIVQLKAAADPYSSEIMDAYSGGFTSTSQVILAIASILIAGALFCVVLSCREGGKRAAGTSLSEFSDLFLLVPPVALVVRLVFTYRLDSINPSLEAYYVELLALVFLTLAFFRLSSFAFGAGNGSRLALYSGLATVFSLSALADGGPHISSLLLYAGSAVTLMGFLLLHLSQTDTVSSDRADCEEE